KRKSWPRSGCEMVSRPTALVRRSPYDLALKAFIARQDDAATVQKREEIAEQFTLGLLGQVIRDAILAEQLARKLAGVSVAGHTTDTIGFQQALLIAIASIFRLVSQF